MTSIKGFAGGLCLWVVFCLAATAQKQPNILFIVADDLGYADLGCYGGIIDTPYLDELAEAGTLFTNFHTAPTCAPTRAMFLTGNDNHIAGVGIQGVQRKEWGYEGYLTDRVVTIPQLLSTVGYHTMIAGKWHLGEQAEHDPYRKGFERSFVLTSGAGNHSNSVSVLGRGEVLQHSKYTENGQVTTWPEGAYSTEFYTDKLISFIDEFKGDGRPFFALATYTSPHWPLQVAEQYWKKYEGKFDVGYEQWRAENLSRLLAKGLLPEGTRLPPLNPDVTPWDSLTHEQQQIEVRKMELYAGMVDHLDGQVGRLIEYLRSISALETTQIIFMSDNGAADEDFYYRGPFVVHSQKHFDNSYENMGKPNSYVSYGPQWAEAGTAAFRDHKGYTREGGVRAPMFITGKGVAKGKKSNAFVSILDLAPTIYDWAGVDYPVRYQEHTIFPLKGESLAGFLETASGVAHDSTYVYAVEQTGDLMIRKGNWKLMNIGYPILEANFELYNLEMDVTESRDLSATFPDKRSEMIDLWRAYQKEARIRTDRY